MSPIAFQGSNRTRSYFEGWYFKLVVPDQNMAYALIPGISYDADGKGEAFLQVLDGVAANSRYLPYPSEEFQGATDRLDVRIGPHHFSTDGVWVDIPDLRIDVRFRNLHPWKKRWYAPGIMGPFGFLPRMQCYHGLVSYHHELSGTITVGEVAHDVAGGVGYAEKDWGSGFPRAWVWCQSNHFTGATGPMSLMASVAHIPFGPTSFVGHLATFLYEGEVFLYTTWARSRVQCEFIEGNGGSSVRLQFKNADSELVITGFPAPGGDLLSPVSGDGMAGKINESLQAELAVALWRKGQLAYEGVGSWAGLEVSANAPVDLA